MGDIMNKKQIFIVKEKDNLINSLCKFKSDISRNKLKSYIKYNMVMVNDKIVTKANYEVKDKDIITIYYNKTMIDEYDIRVLYEDKDIIAISKPCGLLSISNDKEKDVTAFRLVREYVRKNNPNTYLFAIHRLDQETSGVLIFGKNEKIKNMLQDNWNDIVKKRGYYAIVNGKLDKDKGTFKSYLKENRNGIIYSSKNKDGKLAVTNYKVIKSNNKYSLLDIDIETGRRNQIRVHLSEYGYPIVGDKKYGSKDKILKRMGLHSYELSFIDPRNNKLLTIHDDIPKEFLDIVK